MYTALHDVVFASNPRASHDSARAQRHGGWLQLHQQQVITYRLAENRVLKAQLCRTRLKEIATPVTPDTLLRWYARLIAQKFDGSQHRQQHGRPHVTEEVERLIVCMAEENPSWGYRRLQREVGGQTGHAVRRERLGGLLNY